MVSQDNRLLPLPQERGLDRPLSSLPHSKSYGYGAGAEATHLRDYINVVLKRKWLILTLMLVVTSLVAIQMYRLPSIYQAEATIQIEPKHDSILKAGSNVVINTGGGQDAQYWNTQLKLLENPALARQVALTLDLQNNQAFFGNQSQQGVFSALRRIFSSERTTNAQPAAHSNIPVVSEERAREEQLTPEQLNKLEPYEDTLAGSLTVEPVMSTNLVTLKFTHPDPALAQKIVNTFADTFVYNNFERETQGTAKATELLAQKIAELQLDIRRQEEQRVNYIRENDLPPSKSPGADLSAERLAQLSKQLLDAENERKNLQALYESAARQSDPNSIPDVADNKRVASLREQLDQKKQKRAELLVIYTEEWPEVKRIDEQIKTLEEALSRAPREVLATMKSKYEAAVNRENSLRAAYNQQHGEFSQQTQAQIQLTMMDQEIETNTQYLNTLLQRQRELENTSTDTMKTNNVSVSQYSRVPRSPVGPPRLRNIFIAFLLSLGAGIGLAFLLDYLDDTLKSVEDVDRYLHLPALALIPSTRSEQRLRLKGGGAPAEPGDATALALLTDARSSIAEAYRHLRTSILLSSAGQPPKTILVTSSQPSEGKTTTAVNTAVMLAQTGADVLIVDCDLRRPRLHAQFNISNARGVTNYLSGEAGLDEILQSYERLPNLKLMTSGPVPPNPAELLGSDEMRKLLGELGERFTHVIIDSPPAISFTDASILSTLVDGVILVVHGGKSSRAVVRRAKQQLTDVGAHIFGVVLNNVKLESTDYYYYAGYYSSYYNSDDDASEVADAAVEESRPR
ncbi:MAG TPA: polysaccharide biosynthesis tyrosine autokinase [Pyrinomonadaceae bacterium]|nr:polysaccharide biosynthesis tyrosine autokinase [Pyrinomonadaceae bacterium]